MSWTPKRIIQLHLWMKNQTHCILCALQSSAHHSSDGKGFMLAPRKVTGRLCLSPLWLPELSFISLHGNIHASVLWSWITGYKCDQAVGTQIKTIGTSRQVTLNDTDAKLFSNQSWKWIMCDRLKFGLTSGWLKRVTSMYNREGKHEVWLIFCIWGSRYRCKTFVRRGLEREKKINYWVLLLSQALHA